MLQNGGENGQKGQKHITDHYMLTLNAELWQSRLKINDDATFDRIL